MRGLVLVLVLAVPALADKHPLYKPQRTMAGVATFHASHEVGNTFFSLAPIDRADLQATAALSKLTFHQGNPPAEIFGRAYLPASLGELIKSVGYPTRSEALSWQLWLERTPEPLNETVVRPELYDSTTTSASWDGLRHKLAALKPGSYRVIVWVSLNFQMLRPNLDSGLAEWVNDSFSVAHGILPVEVTP